MEIKRDLGEEMAQDDICKTLLADNNISKEFYSALCNVEWEVISELSPDEEIVSRLRGDRKETWYCSWRYAGGIIADIRNSMHNTKEDYMNWYCSGNEGIVSDIVEECMTRLGWKSIKDGND